MPNGEPLPDIFQFEDQELPADQKESNIDVQPEWYKEKKLLEEKRKKEEEDRKLHEYEGV